MEKQNLVIEKRELDYELGGLIMALCYTAFCHDNYCKDRALVYRQMLNMFVSDCDKIDDNRLKEFFDTYRSDTESHGYAAIVNYCVDNISPEYYKKIFIFILEGVYCTMHISPYESEVLKYIAIVLKIDFDFYNSTQQVIVNKVVRGLI